jgi:outer membrane translocation and assembly module TamA
MLKQGYCAYKLNNKAYVDLDNYSVDLIYTLQKGDICVFGKISVEGLTNIDSDIVLSRINISNGENFNIDKIKESYNKLYGLDAFSSISIDYNQNDNIVPLDIFFVQKEKTSNYKIGFGYDSNLGSKASLKWWKDNFMGDAQKLSFSVKLAKDIYEIKNTFYHPILYKIYENDFDFTNSLGYKVEKYNNYLKAKTLYEKFKFGYSNKYFDFYTGFGLENIDLSLEKDDILVKEALDEINSFIIYPYLQAIYDKRDSKLNPKNGYYLSALVEYGLPYNDNASSYTKIMAQGRYIKTLGDLTLATVAKVGFINEIKNYTPDSKKFFAGGSFSNRAYGYNDLGVTLSPTSDSNLSGVSTVNLSFEGDYPIIGDLSGAIFSDISMVSDKENDMSGSYVTTVGAGVRYATPMGPLKVDAGFNIHNASDYGIQFRIGQSF